MFVRGVFIEHLKLYIQFIAKDLEEHIDELFSNQFGNV